MKLPGGTDARVEPKKLREYLLSRTHPTGRFKARFFRAVGLDEAERLAGALREVARTGTVSSRIRTDQGVKYVVDGYVDTLTGNRVPIRTVWIVEGRSEAPRLVTAYPGEGGRDGE